MSDRVPLIALQRVTKAYRMGTQTVRALRGVTFGVGQGDYVAIMGASGSGKTTLMNIVGCLDVPTDGRYLLDGVDVRSLDDDRARRDPQPQDRLRLPELQPHPPDDARSQNVELPLIYAGVHRKERQIRAYRALDPRRVSPSVCTTCPPSSRAVSSSASRSRGRS